MNTRISLCMIVKASDDEAKLLDRCLKSVKGVFDEICITITGQNKKCEYVAKKHNAIISHFDWINDFAAARNFNFSQANGDFVMWLDADDCVKGGDKIKETVERMAENKIDIGIMNYLYDFDEYGRCTVKHLKARIVKNDGCVEWTGKLHEDFKENREVDGRLIEDIEVLHLTDNKRANESAKRNELIAQLSANENKDDPRSLWLLANAAMGLGKKDEAKLKYEEFIEKSGSYEEKYLAYLNLADLTDDEMYCGKAIILKPSYPNAYHKTAELMHKKNKKERAIEFIEIGLQMPIPDKKIIVFNPRDYDYNPLILLMRIYFEMGKNEKALTILETLIKNYPNDKELQKKKMLIEQSLGEILEVDKEIVRLEKIKDKKTLELELMKLPEKLKQHPKVCLFRNLNFIKKTSTGKDLVYYCNYTDKVWNPDVAISEGVGGSEEAVINLSKELVKHGWNVTVYNNCGGNKNYDGVIYKNFWEWNPRDKQDVTILWRHPRPTDYEINSEKIFIDLHDVVPKGEFFKERLNKIDKIMVKTKAHRDLFPNVEDDKFVIIPNGIDVSMFDEEVERNPYLILNTSSADRHLDATLDIFEELISKSDKPWKLAWYYGWGNFLNWNKDDKELMEFYEKQNARFQKLVEAGRAEGGIMIGHKEIAKKYLEAGVFLYPSQFYEIHCISAAKAQAAGCACVTSDFAALNETVMFGNKIHTEGEKWMTNKTFGDTGKNERYIQAIKFTKTHPSQIKKAKEKYNWEKVGKSWNKIL